MVPVIKNTDKLSVGHNRYVVIILLSLIVVVNSTAYAAIWDTLGVGLNDYVSTLVMDSNDNLYVGGGFTTAGGDSANHIAKWDGVGWSALGSGINGIVESIVVDDEGNLYAGGRFTVAGGITAINIAKWNGVEWSALGSGVNKNVSTLILDGLGNLYAGTAYSGPANQMFKWDGVEWVEVGSELWYCVYALTIDSNNNLYAGGEFTRTDIYSSIGPGYYVAKWDGSEWSSVGSWFDFYIDDLAFDSTGKLYAAGQFRDPGYGIAVWDGYSWDSVGTDTNDVVISLFVDDADNLYIGGNFTIAGGEAANYIAKWDGAAWSSLGVGVNNVVLDIASDSKGNLYAGGVFTTAGGEAANYIAKWVLAPNDLIADLINEIFNDEIISYHVKISLTNKLEKASAKLEHGNKRAAINILESLIHHINAISGKKITREKADELIAKIQIIINNISYLAKNISLNETPESIILSQNTPNPFNPTTVIKYTIPSGIQGNVTLKVYDLRGALVRNLVEKESNPGIYSVVWDGTDESANKVSSGVYIYQLQVGQYSKSNKMILMR